VYDGLAYAVIIASLLIGAWCLVAFARHRWLDPSHLAGLAALELALLVQAVIAVVRLVGGERPEQLVTFVGYLITSAIVLPAALVLSFMERTRWGSVIAGGATVVVAALTLRLQQVWTLP
jgi:hypothetical protein